jgi:hypothetical protein
MEIINSESPAPLRLAGYLFTALDHKEKYRPLVLESWVKVFESLLQETGLDFDSLKAIVRFAAKENEWTVTNLRIARDPAVSLRKQWDNIVLHYEANLAAKKARERKSWKYGACPVCDEVESRYGNACESCAQKERQVELDTLWHKLSDWGFVNTGKYAGGKTGWYVGKRPDEALLAAPTSQELYSHFMREGIPDAMFNRLDLLLPRDERIYIHADQDARDRAGAFEREDDDLS